ncbi:hypothetical protein KVL59_07295 [Helicobacter pylori]|nr:hypothetical protein KVL59_07295 [Helicobacter pylori]
MFFKTYQKLLGASCLALYLVGCGNGESPVEMSVNSKGEFSISSKVDSVTIQGVKLNRSNCAVNFVSIGESDLFIVALILDQVTPISIQDFKDMASVYKELDIKERLANMENKISQLEQKGVMMESRTLKFGESLKGISLKGAIFYRSRNTNRQRLLDF